MALRATYFLSVIYGDPVVGGFTVIVKLRENCLLYPAAAELRPTAASSSLSLDPGQCPVSPRVRTPLGRFIIMEFCNYEYLTIALMCCLLLDS